MPHDCTAASNVRVDRIVDRTSAAVGLLSERLDALEKIIACKAAPVTNLAYYGPDRDLARLFRAVVVAMVENSQIPVHGDADSEETQRDALEYLLRLYVGENDPAG